jgi:hypothetical protein
MPQAFFSQKTKIGIANQKNGTHFPAPTCMGPKTLPNGTRLNAWEPILIRPVDPNDDL